MKVKYITGTDFDLESEVNKFLESIKDCKIVDIKFSFSKCIGAVLVCYED